MALGMETGLGPGHIVLDGDPASLPEKGAEPPPNLLVHVYCGQTAGRIKMPLGTEVGLGQKTLCYMGTHFPPKKGTAPPNYRPMSIVAKRLYDVVSGYITWYGGRPKPS